MGAFVSVDASLGVAVTPVRSTWQLERTIGSPDRPDVLLERVTALAFSPDGSLLASGGGEPSRSGELKIWKVSDGSLVRSLPDAHSDTVLAVCFSPDGQLVASGSSDRLAKIFEVQTGQLLRVCEGHTHHVLGIHWRADGRMLATSGANSVIKIWNPLTAEQFAHHLGIRQGGHGNSVPRRER